MQKFKVYGASDDLIEFEGFKGADEYCNGGGRMAFKIYANGEPAYLLEGFYGRNGSASWSFSLGMVNEEVPMPTWPVRIRQGGIEEKSYSAVLEIEIPDGITISVKEITNEMNEV